MIDLPIPNCLSIPTEIKHAIKEKNLALFIGAGVSRLTGCWNWIQLARGLIQKCHELEVIDCRFDYLIRQDIEKEKIPEVFNYCYEALKKNEFLPEYEELIIQSCSEKNEFRIYDELKELAEYYLTTNYDDHFDAKFNSEDIISDLNGLIHIGKKELSIVPGKIYHIHGSVKDPSNIILTQNQYYESYENPFRRQVSFLCNP